MITRIFLEGRPALVVLTALLALPVLSVLGSWWAIDPVAGQILYQMASTVLPNYFVTSLYLCVGVGLGVVLTGTATALLVSLCEFPGRRFFSVALMLPLAMPAYVLAYAYTDFLQYSGPLQSALRSTLGGVGPLWPDVRSLGGAVLVFIFALYPYVYILVRTALADSSHSLMAAARLLQAFWWRRVWRVALPLARPAIAAGTALVLMEVLADFGVSSYFGVQTFTAGIYKAWLVMDHRVAAAQLASVLLLLVVALLAWEKRAQSRRRYAGGRVGVGVGESALQRLHGWRAGLACCACALPWLLGFVGPVLILLYTLMRSATEVTPDWGRFAQWAGNSLMLASLTAALACGLGLWLAAQHRLRPSVWSHSATAIVGLGYAMPGAVVVVGLLWPVAWLQHHWPQLGAGHWLSATIAGLVWAYLVRFVAVALQSVQSGYARIPPALDDSARLLGSRPLRLVRRVHGPLLAKPLAAAALLVFVDVIKELPVTLVLRPFNTDTLAVMAHQLARDERLGEAALPALALVLVGLLPVLWLNRALHRG